MPIVYTIRRKRVRMKVPGKRPSPVQKSCQLKQIGGFDACLRLARIACKGPNVEPDQPRIELRKFSKYVLKKP